MEYWLLAACVLAGIALAVVGVVRVVRAALGLKKRLDAYADLPLRVDVALAQRRIALAERRIATVPVLASRADGAVRSIALARSRVATMAATVVRVVRRPRASR